MAWLLKDLPPKMQEQAQRKLRGEEKPVVEAKPNKYNAKKVVVGSLKFDSKHEYAEYTKLVWRARAGEISGLRVHVKFSLFDPGENCRGEHWATYRSDFLWWEGGKMVVADAKSEPTRKRRDWKKTKQAMLACHSIEVLEL